jgi:hypothetical protein
MRLQGTVLELFEAVSYLILAVEQLMMKGNCGNLLGLSFRDFNFMIHRPHQSIQ